MSTEVITRTQCLTALQSLNVVKNAVRSAFSSIAYLRNLFEEDAFEDKTIGDLQLKLLRPHGPEAALVLSWFERGVFDALEKQYLRLLAFGIHSCSDELLECYHFRFTYDEEGTSMNVTRKNGAVSDAISAAKIVPRDEARDQTLSLIKSLIVLTQSLTPLPPMHHLSLKLWYYDEKVPDDYEPEFFRPTDPEHQLRFGTLPQDCDIGELNTGIHGIAVRIKTIAEADESGAGDEGGHSERLSTSTTTSENKEDGTVLMQWLSDHPSFNKNDLAEAFKLDERSTNSTIQRLQRSGKIGRYNRRTKCYTVQGLSSTKCYGAHECHSPPSLKRPRVA